MGKKQQMKIKAREAREEQQARKVFKGLFFTLILLAILIIAGYSIFYA